MTVCGTLTASDTVTVNGTVTMYDGRVTPYVIVWSSDSIYGTLTASYTVTVYDSVLSGESIWYTDNI